MTIVFTSVFQEEALVVKSLLESAGIEAALFTEGMLDITPLFGPDIKGVRIGVPDAAAEDARAIVADYREKTREPETR